MALYTTPDGRVVIGTGVSDGNDYHGYNGKRDIVIQLTADGATDDGLNALEYLKAYATNAKAENKPIFPNGTRVWISTNGYTKAVEADDVVIDGDNITIGGIAWNGSAWDFTNAGQTGGGDQLPTPTAQDVGKVATVVNNSGTYEYGLETPQSGGGVLVVTITEDNGSYVADKTYEEIVAAYPNVSAVFQTGDSNEHSVYDQYNESNNKVLFGFVNPYVKNAVLFEIFTINSDNTVTVIERSVSVT